MFNKFAGYEINMQQPTVFLYTSNAQFKKWNKETIPFKMASKMFKNKFNKRSARFVH